MEIGEIYFIGERDRTDGGRSSYVKIGMVNSITKDSADRLRQHQTGNPRDLHLIHVTQTPGPFRVERFLHQQFGASRVRSEWFRLTDEEVARAIQMAEQLGAEAFVHIPVIDEAELLGKVVSTGQKIAATDESIHWLRLLSEAKAALKWCAEMAGEYRSVAIELPEEVKEEAELEELFVTEHYVEKRFDAAGFAIRYPAVAAQFTEITRTVSGRFTPRYMQVDLVEVDPELMLFAADFKNACDEVNRGRMDFGELFDMRQRLEQFYGAYSWDEKIADSHLRVLCGDTSGIEGQVTWNRVTKESSSLDEEGLESSHSEEYRQFVAVEMKTRIKTRRRARRKS